MGPSVKGVLSISSNGSAPLNNMATIYGKKTLKNLLQNQESFDAESLYISSGTQVYQICSNDDPRKTFDLFMARSNLCSHTFIWGNC